MNAGILARARAVTQRQQRREVVFFQPAGARCRNHDWRQEAGGVTVVIRAEG